MVFNNKKKQFLQIKKTILSRDGSDKWFYTELESIKNSIMQNHGAYYSQSVEEKNIERLQQLVWWLEDEKKNKR